MIPLFDYIKLVFSKNEKDWKELSNTDKSRNFFMLNRFMAIKYPYQASHLCHYKIDPIAVSDYWHRIMSSQFSSTPNWIYAKTVKKKAVKIKCTFFYLCYLVHLKIMIVMPPYYNISYIR